MSPTHLHAALMQRSDGQASLRPPSRTGLASFRVLSCWIILSHPRCHPHLLPTSPRRWLHFSAFSFSLWPLDHRPIMADVEQKFALAELIQVEALFRQFRLHAASAAAIRDGERRRSCRSVPLSPFPFGHYAISSSTPRPWNQRRRAASQLQSTSAASYQTRAVQQDLLRALGYDDMLLFIRYPVSRSVNAHDPTSSLKYPTRISLNPPVATVAGFL